MHNVLKRAPLTSWGFPSRTSSYRHVIGSETLRVATYSAPIISPIRDCWRVHYGVLFTEETMAQPHFKEESSALQRWSKIRNFGRGTVFGLYTGTDPTGDWFKDAPFDHVFHYQNLLNPQHSDSLASFYDTLRNPKRWVSNQRT
ncbi:MAG: hypothetical protein ACI8Y7_001060 [Candidatus Woesearchaeota archaeon]|jgi:hypothetical protein